MLIPETLELTPTQAGYVRELAAGLARYGFDLSPFGGQTFVLKAVPAPLAGKDAIRTLEEIVEAAEGFKLDQGLTGFEDTLLQSLACHAAIKAGDERTTSAPNASDTARLSPVFPTPVGPVNTNRRGAVLFPPPIGQTRLNFFSISRRLT